MNRKLIFAIILLSVLTCSVFTAFGVGKFFRIRWDFTPNPSWPLGYPGRVLFDIWIANSGAISGIDVDGYLSGAFWLGNVWWGTFSHGNPTVTKARVLCTNNVFNDPTFVCPLDGFGWSQNAGWISLSGSFINNGTWVYYNPASWRIEGFGDRKSVV